MAKKSPVSDLVDQFSDDFKKLAKQASLLIDKYIREGSRPNKAIENALKEVGFFPKLEILIKEDVLTAAKIGYGDEVVKKEEFLKPFDIKSQILSSGIDLSIKDEVISAVRQSRTYLEIANQLVDTRDISGKLPKYLEEILPATKKNFKGRQRSRINKAIGNISKLAQNGVPNTRLKNAYSNLVRVIKSENDLKIKKAIDRAMFEKARYRAERIARTEIANAQGLAHDLKSSMDDDVIGVKYSLSTRHKIYDICDFNTSVDLYDMGPGVYPKNLHPPYPFHPHCLCVPSEVFVGEAKIGSYDSSKAKDWIKSRNYNQQKQLLGIEGREKFKESGIWQGKLRNWQGHDKPDFKGIDESFFLK